jgi:hypothetical protein
MSLIANLPDFEDETVLYETDVIGKFISSNPLIFLIKFNVLTFHS